MSGSQKKMIEPTNIPWGAFSVALPACRAQKRLPRAILGHTKTFEESKAQKPPLDTQESSESSRMHKFLCWDNLV